MIMFALMLPFLLVPMVGLAIDATMLFSVKAKLQAAVDGGAIAAAQSLNSGLTFTTQQAAAQKAADQFLRANIVVAGAVAGYNGYWGAYNLKDGPNANDTNTDCLDSSGQPAACIVAAQDDKNKRRTVTVTASVQVPLLFMRIFGFSNGTVAATGMAARRDVVLVLVIDRSSSMDNVIDGTPVMTTLQAAAKSFVNQFQAGRDRLGLVVFGGSALVAYPPGDWGKDPNAGTLSGPDTSFNDESAHPGQTIPDLIGDIAITTNTGTAEALMLAYKELVAAYQPGALNVIVLFTDGQPNGITANFNGTTYAGLGASVVKSTSGCSYKSDAGSNPSMIGWLAQWGGYAAGNTTAVGIFGLAQTDTTTQTSVINWLSLGTEPVIPPGPQSAGLGGQNGPGPGKGCGYEATDTSSSKDSNGKYTGTLFKTVANDVTIPAYDYYGNSTTGSSTSPYTTSDYKQSTIWTDTDKCNNGHRPSSQSLSNAGDACQIGLASWNATDMAGRQIRNDANGLSPVIYSMGFTGNGGVDAPLMNRLSNIKGASTVYDSTKGKGMYLQISVPSDIAPAFQTVLAEILRLSM